MEALVSVEGALASCRFRLIGPDVRPGEDRLFHVRRADGSLATLIETPASPLEAAIVDFGPEDGALKELLAPLLPIRRMSRLTNAALLNVAVRSMPEDRAFVNVGVWNGFTMLAAMAGNDDKLCVGVDNFSEFGGPKEAFLERFASRRSQSHRFFDRDYVDFFAAGLDRPLGVYLYDGEHSYENQYRGLMVADPFYAEDALVVVDDTNLERARRATLDFVRDSRLEWRVVYDQRTARTRHPTLWNGLMILRAGGGVAEPFELPVVGSIAADVVGEEAGEEGGGVSVLSLGEPDVSGLDGDEEVEVVVAGQDELRAALLERTSGRYVSIAEEGACLSSRSIAHAVRHAIEAGRKARTRIAQTS
jgi:Methyltransferase domain